MSWAWWDWPLTKLTNHRHSVLWRCRLGHLTHKIVSKMTYNVTSGTLNPIMPYHSTDSQSSYFMHCNVITSSSSFLACNSRLRSAIRYRRNKIDLATICSNFLAEGLVITLLFCGWCTNCCCVFTFSLTPNSDWQLSLHDNIVCNQSLSWMCECMRIGEMTLACVLRSCWVVINAWA